MAATKDWEALLYGLVNSTAVTNIVADNGDGKPAIVYGNFTTEQNNYPSISINRLNKVVNYGIEDGLFSINCWALTEYESSDLAEVVNNLFRSSVGDLNGYTLYTDSSIVSSIPDGDVWNTPVYVRIIHYTGVR